MSPPSSEFLGCYRVGRSTNRADITIEDHSHTVSGVHAELGVDALGRWHYIDRSTNGTEIFREGNWQPFAQGVIFKGERLRLGSRELSTDWLIEQAQRCQRRTPPTVHPAPPRLEVVARGGITERLTDLPRTPPSSTTPGRFTRDPETGAIRRES